MNRIKLLDKFLVTVTGDVCIGSTHICMYLVLLYFFQQAHCENPFTIECAAVMRMMKISSRGTYNRVIKQLHAGGYIEYMPSHRVGETRVKMKQAMSSAIFDPYNDSKRFEIIA